MAYEQKAGDAALFRNDKGDNPKRPDYTGKGLDPNGEPIKLSGWVKDGQKGKFLSLRIEHITPPPPVADGGSTEAADDGALPF